MKCSKQRNIEMSAAAVVKSLLYDILTRQFRTPIKIKDARQSKTLFGMKSSLHYRA